MVAVSQLAVVGMVAMGVVTVFIVIVIVLFLLLLELPAPFTYLHYNCWGPGFYRQVSESLGTYSAAKVPSTPYVYRRYLLGR